MSPSITFAASATNSKPKQSIYAPPAKKQKMSITQTYYLAHSARGKLSKEAARGDHDLRLLVGHANMLDSLMIDLANAEQEQERWFNRSLTGAHEEEEQEQHHEETIMEEPEAEWEAESDEETELVDVHSEEVEMEEDEDADDNELQLVRSPTRHSPPELTIDADSDSEDEHMPPSPPNASLDNIMSEKQRQAIATTSYYERQEASISPVEAASFEEDGFFLPSKSQPTIIAAY